MKNRFIVIYTVFAAAVFIFSLGFFGYNLFNEYSTNLKKSESKFTEFSNDIRTISYSQEENNTAYIQAIKKAVGDAADYSFIQVRRSNETVVLYPTGKSREETMSKLTKSFTSSLTVNKQNISIDCNIYLIRPDSIFYYARISFLMILIITIITIIMIIYLSLTENTSDVISLEEDTDTEDSLQEEDIEDDEVPTSENLNEEGSETIENSQSDVNPETSEKSQSEEAQPEAVTSSNSESSVSEEKAEDDTETNHAEVTPEEVKAILSEPLTDAETAATRTAQLPIDEIKPAVSNEPSGLFDPETGIGWESYLFTRLNNEIDRATASEIDLSLFIIKMPGIDKTSEEFKNVCNYLAIQFQFKDLLFEHKEDSIVAIKISMNIDEALVLADKLYPDISNIVNSKSPRIGLSSRSIRMVTADRLMLEAEQAIEHSDESSPVIAFRVDSEKYRQLMEQNSGN